MMQRKAPEPRFDIGDWVAYPIHGGRRVGRVVEYDSHLGLRPRSYGMFVYSPDQEPQYTWASEDDLLPATPEEITTHSALATTQEHPRIFRDPLGPRR